MFRNAILARTDAAYNAFMNCPRCGKFNQPQAAFCMHCGWNLRLQPPSNTSVSAAPQSKAAPQPAQPPVGANIPPVNPSQVQNPYAPKKQTILYITLGVLFVATLFAGFGISQLLSQTSTQGGSKVLDQSAKTPGSDVLSKTNQTPESNVLSVNSAPPATTILDKSRKTMPGDIRAWLEHLEECERRRHSLAMKGFGALMAMAPSAQMGLDISELEKLASGEDPGADIKSSAEQIGETADSERADWAKLQEFFLSKPAPSECVPIRNNYRNALDETAAMISDILGAVAQSREDTKGALESLYKMKNTSKSIDEYGKKADGGVADICDRYETQKWFKIESDFGSGGMLSSFLK